MPPGSDLPLTLALTLALAATRVTSARVLRDTNHIYAVSLLPRHTSSFKHITTLFEHQHNRHSTSLTESITPTSRPQSHNDSRLPTRKDHPQIYARRTHPQRPPNCPRQPPSLTRHHRPTPNQLRLRTPIQTPHRHYQQTRRMGPPWPQTRVRRYEGLGAGYTVLPRLDRPSCGSIRTIHQA